MSLPISEPKVSVVIVSFNTRDLLRRAVASVAGEHEVVVVDNASTDGSAEMVRIEFPGVRLIANAENRGFGPANNQGIDVATGSLILLLNSDAYATEGAVRRLAAAFEDPTVVAAGGKLLHPDGRLQESVASRLTLWAVFCEQTLLEKAFRRSKVFSPYWLSRRLCAGRGTEETPPPNLQVELAAGESLVGPSHQGGGTSQTFAVAQVMGACLMMRPVERFDERFFLYCEDTELCERLNKHGRIVYLPDAEFVHELGSSSQTRWQAVARYNRGKELFFAIHRGRAASAACFLLDRLGALMRMVGWALALRPGKAALFAKVFAAPVTGPPRPNG